MSVETQGRVCGSRSTVSVIAQPECQYRRARTSGLSDQPDAAAPCGTRPVMDPANARTPLAVPRLGLGLPDRLAGAWIEQAGLPTVIVATVALDDLLD